MEVATNPYIMLLDEEHRILHKTRKLREEIVDTFIEEKGIPTRSGDMRVVNELLNSMDTNVTSVVDLRLKHEDNKQSEDLTDAIATIFNKINIASNKIDINKKETIVTDKFVPDDIVPGEDEIEYVELDVDAIMPTIAIKE
ncbi:MAG: hypothetical protein DRJ64_01630 [Thermoprotei archaeon]|nr:MAG: hypothetical protein DRJ64_01630 [Thermoprotei archaeon]